MRVVQASIGGMRNFLADNQDLDALKAEIESACAAGGSFVDVRLSGDRVLSVLITAATPVTFEVMDVEEEEFLDDESSENGRLRFDGDYWVD